MAIAISAYYYSGFSNVAEYVALFTSVATAMYAILTEPKERTEPFLRITPLRSQPYTQFLRYNIDLWIENIGYSIAKDIEVKCKASDGSIYVKNGGIFKHPLLAPREIVHYSAIELAGDEILSRQLIIEASYFDEDDRKQKPIRREVRISELGQGLKEVKVS